MEDVFKTVDGGDVTALRRLMEADPSVAAARDAAGLSVVLHALYRGREDMAAIVAAARPELDVFEAAALGDADRVARLVEADPDQVNALSGDGFTPLHLAVFFGHPETAGVLVEKGADVSAVSRNRMNVTPLHSAVAGRNREAVAMLLEAGADVNADSHAGFTPLLDAAQSGDRDIVELLLTHGADRSARLADGKTARDLALAGSHREVVDLLEERD